MILADTSVWIRFLRDDQSGPGAQLREQLVAGSVLICGPVVAELLARERQDRKGALREGLIQLPFVDQRQRDWLTAGELRAELAALGATTSLIDIMIALAAVKGDAELWTLDSDFQRIAGVLEGLRLRLLA